MTTHTMARPIPLLPPSPFLRRYTAVMNPILRFGLRSRLHRVARSRLVALLSYDASITRARVTLPVMYVQHRQGFFVFVAEPEQKRWWRSFATERSVEVLVRGHTLAAKALRSTDPEEIEHAFRLYIAKFPRVAHRYPTPDGLVLIRIAVDGRNDRDDDGIEAAPVAQ